MGSALHREIPFPHPACASPLNGLPDRLAPSKNQARSEAVPKFGVSIWIGANCSKKTAGLRFDLRSRGSSRVACSDFLCGFAPLREAKPFWKRDSRKGAKTQSCPDGRASTPPALSARNRVFCFVTQNQFRITFQSSPIKVNQGQSRSIKVLLPPFCPNPPPGFLPRSLPPPSPASPPRLRRTRIPPPTPPIPKTPGARKPCRERNPSHPFPASQNAPAPPSLRCPPPPAPAATSPPARFAAAPAAFAPAPRPRRFSGRRFGTRTASPLPAPPPTSAPAIHAHAASPSPCAGAAAPPAPPGSGSRFPQRTPASAPVAPARSRHLPAHGPSRAPAAPCTIPPAPPPPTAPSTNPGCPSARAGSRSHSGASRSHAENDALPPTGFQSNTRTAPRAAPPSSTAAAEILKNASCLARSP